MLQLNLDASRVDSVMSLTTAGRPFLHVDLLSRPDRYKHVMDFVHETPGKPG